MEMEEDPGGRYGYTNNRSALFVRLRHVIASCPPSSDPSPDWQRSVVDKLHETLNEPAYNDTATFSVDDRIDGLDYATLLFRISQEDYVQAAQANGMTEEEAWDVVNASPAEEVGDLVEDLDADVSWEDSRKWLVQLVEERLRMSEWARETREELEKAKAGRQAG